MHNSIKRQLYRAAVCTGVMVMTLMPVSVSAADGYTDVAGGSDTASVQSIGKYGMTPIAGSEVRDGTYNINVDTSSRFFRVKQAKLTVKNGKMEATIMIDSTSYECIYLGVAEKAAQAEKEEYIFADQKSGRSYFTIPVESLDKAISCAAFSSNTKKWYDREILFDATSLSSSALKFTLPDYDKIQEAMDAYDGSESSTSTEVQNQEVTRKEPLHTNMEDGDYSIEVSMTGGSGRATITSPTYLIVKKSHMYARLVWSSSHYEYMLVNGKKYMNEAEDGGNSTFTIPITAMDSAMDVVGCTTALGDPLEIDYHITFYRNSIGSSDLIPQVAAKKVLAIALTIIIVGGILNYFLKRKRKQ